MSVFGDIGVFKKKLILDIKEYMSTKYPGYVFKNLKVEADDIMVIFKINFTDPGGHKWTLTRAFGLAGLSASRVPVYDVVRERLIRGLDSNLKRRQQLWQ